MSVESCCSQLARAFPSSLAYPGSPAYQATEQSYWSLQEQELTPTCIFTPSSAQDVSTAVSILAAPNSTCSFAVKGQTHAPAAGFANIDDGVTIDMTFLDSVALSDDRTVASVGAGASWLDVYAHLDLYNVSVAGGRNGHVGVGGLTLGGGISYFGPRAGWACDNVVNYEIVLADGSLANANATSYPDLFRSLRGGGNNFGIVTRFDLAAFEQSELLVGTISTPFSEREAVSTAFFEFANASDYDEYASIVTGMTWTPSGAWANISTTAAYTKLADNPAAFDPLRTVPNTTSSFAATRLSVVSNETATPLWEWAFYTATYGVSPTLLSRLADSFNETLSNTSIPGLILFSFAFEPLPTVITQHGDKYGGNSLGTSPADGNAVVMLVSSIWNDTSSDALVKQTNEKLLDDANGIAEEIGVVRNFTYMNYAAPGQDPIGSYGADNVERLEAASRRYDPKGVFQKQVPGGFKLP